MKRRQRWREVLASEMRRWQAMPVAQLESALREPQNYEVAFGADTYQVEIEILRATDRELQVIIAIDDGSLPASILPATEGFAVPRPGRRD